MPTGQSDLFVRLRFVVQEPFETATGPFGQPEGFGSLSEPIFPRQKLPVSGSPILFVDHGDEMKSLGLPILPFGRKSVHDVSHLIHIARLEVQLSNV